MQKPNASDLIKRYMPLIAKIDGAKRQKLALSMIRKFKPTSEEMAAVIKRLQEDRWEDPFWALSKVRKTGANKLLTITFDLEDSRVVDGVNTAAKAANTTPDELAKDALMEYLQDRSYIPRNVAEQLDTLKFVKEAMKQSPVENRILPN
jgi:hypothetical protein